MSNFKQGGQSAVAVPKGKTEPTARQRRAITGAKRQYDARPARPDPVAEMTEAGLVLVAPHSDTTGFAHQLAEPFGSSSRSYVKSSLGKICEVVGTDNDQPAAALAMMAAIGPEDELEAALAQQMVASHDLAMAMSARTKNATTIEQMTAFGNLATKFSRTFAQQVDALHKLRNGGAQVVRHVHVYQGGQAIVADTFNAGRSGNGNNNIGNQSHAAAGFAHALPGQNAIGGAVPIRPGEGQEAVSDARRDKPRRAARQ